MRYLSVDIETTGLDPSWCQILEIGAVVDDLDNEYKNEHHLCGGRHVFHCYVVHDRIMGQHFALQMNQKILERIAKRDSDPNLACYNFWTPEEAVNAFEDFLYTHFATREFKKLTVAGKNFASFDRNFLKELPDSERFMKRFHHRSIDPSSLYYEKGDMELPSLDLCLQRAGFDEVVSHSAVEDAFQVIKVLRKKMT